MTDAQPTRFTTADQRKISRAMSSVPFSGDAMHGMSLIGDGDLTVDDVVRFLENVAKLTAEHIKRGEKRDLKMRQMEELLRGARDWHSFLNRRDPETGEPIKPENDLV